MAILVSGGAGYIGSHTCIELLNAGYDVVVADNYYNASPVVLDRIKQITGKDFRFYKADMTKHEDVEHIFSECPDITAVIQFAAYKAVGESVSKPIEYYYNNLGEDSVHRYLQEHIHLPNGQCAPDRWHKAVPVSYTHLPCQWYQCRSMVKLCNVWG